MGSQGQKKCEKPKIINITGEQVQDKWMGLKVNKSPGPNGLPAMVWEKMSALIGNAFVAILQNSQDSGNIWIDWKAAGVYWRNKGERKQNYRAVVLSWLFYETLGIHIEEVISRH